MVEFHDDEVSDAKADAIAITGAFRAASDDDVRNVMNAMSNPTQDVLDSLKFYIVSKSWFLKAWPLLTARSHDNVKDSWREHVGRIQNSELMNIEHEVSSSDDEDEKEAPADQQKKNFDRLNLRMAKNREQAAMKAGLQHTKDYFFLGSSAWMLVKEKFGFDGYELARPLLSGSNNTLSIQLKPEESERNTAKLIDIPPSGRFPYEKSLVNAAIMSGRLTLVPEEDKGSSRMMFPGVASSNPQEDMNTDESPILLLPPSTSVASSSGLYSSVQNLEIESERASNLSDDAPMSGRKRLASGLGNLGNTCFMNSTLQCLVHTEPLRNYFLSGEYEPDLNRDNPLGTGGELATQFANLIREVWGLPSKRRNVLGTVGSYASSTSAVYPRNFKHCVGKHAEQFMGYDQHDSQEFATYLLDALHEDTNRITKKPYIEKPEQGEDETDDVAAHKAWGLHLQREDSRVLENFMGQVKSRLECSEDTCNRVSTTFDPFMYLSVPIPGATDRTLKVTFVPLKPNQRSMNLSLTVNKTASLSKFLAKINEKLVNVGICNENIELRDLLAVDVWNHEVFSWYKNDAEIDRIRPTDNTFVYELRAISEIEEASKNNDVKDEYEIKLDESKLQQKYKLNLATMTQLNKDDDWQKELDIYAKNVHTLYSMFNPRRGTIDERMQFHKKLENFIDGCHHEIGNDEPSGLKRTREDSDTDKNSDVSISTTDESIQGLIEHSDRSLHFKGVKSRHDVAVLEFIAKKIRQFILKLVHDKKDQTKDGVIIQVSMKRPQNGIHTSSQGTGFALPLLLRIPPSMSVYDLRKELASRLSRALQSEEKRRTQSTNSGESSAEIVDEGSDPMNDDDGPFGSPELMIMRQVPLTFDRKGTYSSKSSSSSNKQLGMLEKVSKRRIQPQQAIFADPKNEAEKAMVADIVGQQGTVVLEWPLELLDRVFDLNEYETIDDTEANVDPVEKTEALTTVLDCIQKHCQKEQLEETEMWYCNKCAKHVRAWKQFHLYRSPPILIVHLKRFHYSATTHRRDKITSFIDFPLEGLDLTEMVSHYSEEEKPIYNCYAVSNHYGGLGGGHYTAHILNDDGEWCYYDDSRVTTKVDANEVVSEAAYVLYYRRQDVPIGHDVVEQTVPFSYNMIFEGIEDTNPESEISSNNSGLIADEDMAVDGSSPMGSLGGPDIMESSDMGLILPLEEPETANKDSLLQ